MFAGSLSSERHRIYCLVKGRVQGVFFRVATQERAQELGLVGYARNLPDGTVEVEAEGEQEKLKRLIEFLKTGPAKARVDNIELKWHDPVGKEQDFLVY